MADRDARLELRIPWPLKEWAMGYAKRHNTTISALVVRFFTRLQQEESKKSTDAEQV